MKSAQKYSNIFIVQNKKVGKNHKKIQKGINIVENIS